MSPLQEKEQGAEGKRAGGAGHHREGVRQGPQADMAGTRLLPQLIIVLC